MFHYSRYYDESSDGYRLLKKHINISVIRKQPSSKNLIKEFSSELAQFSEIYHLLYNPLKSSFNSNEIEYINKLMRLNRRAHFFPLIMSFWFKFRIISTFHDDFEELLRLCEVFCFRIYFVAEYRSDNSWGMLMGLANSVFKGEKTSSDVISSIKSKINDLCNDSIFAKSIKGKAYGWKGTLYFFYERELDLLSTMAGSPMINWSAISNDSIEHILPQTPTPYWEGIFSGTTYEDNLHTLSNLTITQNNSTLSNHDYPTKCSIYSKGALKSSFLVEKEIPSNYSAWDVSSIAKRMNELSTWALKRWKL